MPFVWDLIDAFNSCLFSLRYSRRIMQVEQTVLQKYAILTGMKLYPIKDVHIKRLIDFFYAQPEEAYTFFKPHDFDYNSLKKLQRNRSFLAYVLVENDHVVAYCFIRSFFFGKGFRGRMVGMDFRGKGLGTLMNKLMNEIGFSIGLRLYETVSKDNIASYRSALSASSVKVVEEMKNNELYLEIINE